MTKQEFTNRTNVEVTAAEFDIINAMYMSCECDKDEFCKMWVYMNPNRVAKAVKEQKEAELKAQQIETAYTMSVSLDRMNAEESLNTLAVNAINKQDIEFLKTIGIEMQVRQGYYNNIPRFIYVYELKYELARFLHAA